jgi:nicotinamide-nucleotide amidase
MKAEIITIGDELLIGQVIDTNSAWLGQQLSQLGIKVIHKQAVSDTEDAILQALKDAASRANLILITGGLGPTKDDITKKTLCKYFNTELVVNEEVMSWVTSIFERRKLPMLESNKLQAMVPSNCEVLFNENGTAPGMWFEKNNCVYVSMPGVPFEMKSIFADKAIPKIQTKFTLPSIIHRTILTASIGESFLAKKIEAWENALPDYIKLAYLPSVGQVRLRLSGSSSDKQALQKEMEALIEKLYQLCGAYIYGEENDTLQEVIGRKLKNKKATLSTAESCTGGYVAHLITSVPGSSAYYKGSIISYANEIKHKELSVSTDVISNYGAVSEACVKQMAEGVRKKMNTDFAIATSGIAGPDGGTAEKPVGTVWIAIATSDKTIAQQFNMGDNRERTIQRTALQALFMLNTLL